MILIIIVDFKAYISLYDHPGIGQTHISLCTEELKALLQIPLGVVIDLRKQKTEEKQDQTKKIRLFSSTNISIDSVISQNRNIAICQNRVSQLINCCFYSKSYLLVLFKRKQFWEAELIVVMVRHRFTCWVAGNRKEQKLIRKKSNVPISAEDVSASHQ